MGKLSETRWNVEKVSKNQLRSRDLSIYEAEALQQSEKARRIATHTHSSREARQHNKTGTEVFSATFAFNALCAGVGVSSSYSSLGGSEGPEKDRKEVRGKRTFFFFLSFFHRLELTMHDVPANQIATIIDLQVKVNSL